MTCRHGRAVNCSTRRRRSICLRVARVEVALDWFLAEALAGGAALPSRASLLLGGTAARAAPSATAATGGGPARRAAATATARRRVLLYTPTPHTTGVSHSSHVTHHYKPQNSSFQLIHPQR